jgi:hypothetical protein
MLDAAKMSAEGARKKKRTCIIICGEYVRLSELTPVIIAIILLIALLVGVIVPTIKK